MTNIRTDNNFKTPWIVGHRGYCAKYPENTLISFQAAVEAGARMIELDVMLSRDRKVTVIHDATLERTTNGHGNVAEFNLAELQQLDAGSWFDSRFADQQVPQLSEVLDLLKGRVYINIEIKSNAYESHHPPDAIEKQVVELLRRQGLLDTSIVSSFDVNILEQIASMKNIPAIALISEKPADNKTVQLCTRLNVFSWHPDHRIVTASQVQKMHAARIRVFPYTVDKFEDFIRMQKMNVDGVITNDPALAGCWLEVNDAGE